MSDALPISQPYDLGRLPTAGDAVTIVPSEQERARIAAWADLEAVKALTAKIELRKLSASRFDLDIRLDADIVQACVVTLEPVPSHIARDFTRELTFAAGIHRLPVKEIDIAPVGEDGIEEIDSLRYDLAAPVLEELVLAIDPYPRAPGVAFESPLEADPEPEHPFAALKALKDRS